MPSDIFKGGTLKNIVSKKRGKMLYMIVKCSDVYARSNTCGATGRMYCLGNSKPVFGACTRLHFFYGMIKNPY